VSEDARLLFYCHNAYGLGHVVRSLRIAEAALDTGGVSCALITGCRSLPALSVDPRIRTVALRPIAVTDSGFVDLDPAAEGDPIAARSRAILDLCRAWRPDVVVVDHHPLGLGGELMATLLAAADERWPTHFVWGIPYAEVAGGLLHRPRNPRVIRALERYDSALAYTDPDWIDGVSVYRDYILPRRLHYTGLITGRPLPACPGPRPLVVGLNGGGAGGTGLFDLLLAATDRARRESALGLRFVIGPLGEAERIEARGDRAAGVEVWRTGSVEEAVRDAAVAVSRCGYNTAYTLARSEAPLVLVPLATRGTEQHDRAHRLGELDRVWVVEEAAPDGAARLAAAIAEAARAPRGPRPLPFRVDGAREAAAWLLDAACGDRTSRP
jgi:predicted glycosyltransferase